MLRENNVKREAKRAGVGHRRALYSVHNATTLARLQSAFQPARYAPREFLRAVCPAEKLIFKRAAAWCISSASVDAF